ncbi:hypothetical protein Back2_23010 [Nocardioides baekrokdamisoli]|uniref:Lipoprotein n=1 Tax=Nocardioides baekrokdamisoli TaxID=1804624 RepID=A0A3G9J3K9_9ACTN|nr:hypothetical protein Back2_23010 [Nocardioides baekrokdamisoli]
MAARFRLSILGPLVVLALVGCGTASGYPSAPPSTSQGDHAARRCFDPGYTRTRAMYIGLTLNEARSLAKRRSEILVPVAENGSCLLRAGSYYPNAVQIEMRNDRIYLAFSDS